MPADTTNSPIPEKLQQAFAELRKSLNKAPLFAPAVANEDAADALRFELALRGRCDPRAFLQQPASTAADRAAVLDSVAADCDTGGRGERRWLLLDPVRMRVLRSRAPADVAQAVKDAANAQPDEVTGALEKLYVKPLADPRLLTGPQLRALIAAAAWTEGKAVFTYDTDDLRRLLAKLSRKHEYERHVAAGVYGRAVELARITAFLRSPLPSGQTHSDIKYLHVFGSGGIGKSTLIASALSNILRDDEQAVLVHLDFDREDLNVTQSSTMDLELLRQAGLATPEMNRSLIGYRERIRAQLADELVSGDGAMRQSLAQESAESIAKTALVDSLLPLRALQRPLLMVLDTFEQVEAGGGLYTGALQNWLGEIHAATGAPEIRVLVSGRTHPKEGAFALARDEDLMPLDELSAQGSKELLISRGVPAAITSEVRETFGGNPLYLRLAADLLARLGTDAITEVMREARDGKLPKELVQGVLYDRFLRHVEPPADGYAHPGLVLPEITADLIRRVLVPAMGQPDIDDSRADVVFQAFASTTWLMRTSTSGRAVTQRRDLRQLMLKLMNSDPQRAELVAKVRDLAIQYHSALPGLENRAFVLYHRLMQVRGASDLGQFSGVNFGEISTALRPHLDDLPEIAKSYVQARMFRSLGAEEARQLLPDSEWARYLAGDNNEAGEGDRLVQSADPMIALTLWRQRPVRTDGQLPVFVLQALCDTAEWEDPAREGALNVLSSFEPDDQSIERLYWLTRLQLLRGKPLSGLHRECLSRIFGGERADYVALTAVAEAFSKREIMPAHIVADGKFASETRLYLVHTTRFAYSQPFEPHLDALVVLQRNWAARNRKTGIDSKLLEEAQRKLDALHGAPLDLVSKVLKELRYAVKLTLKSRSAADGVLLLRGTTPEFYRPIRQALREALTRPEQIMSFMKRLREALSICPSDLEPEGFVPRAIGDPANWFLALVQCADRARAIDDLLRAALAEAPGHRKLTRVRDAWSAWDLAIGNGVSSHWNGIQRENVTERLNSLS